MLNEPLSLLVATVVGFSLGVAFYGGLWWTVRKGVASHRPALWFLVSLLLRMSLVLSGFYYISDGRWQRLLLCLSGFILGRLVVTRLTRGKERPDLSGGGGRSCA